MLEEAEKEANRILEEARERAQALANEQEVVRLAESQAADILDKARSRSARSDSAPRTTPTRCSPTSKSTWASS